MATSWHWFVVIVTVANIAACLWLIVWTARQGDTAKQAMDTLDHSWDGDLRERNNPLPRWWLALFVGTIFWGLGYLVWYPGLGAYAGIGNWTQIGQYQAERQRIDAVYQGKFRELAALDYTQLQAHTEAMEIASRLFAANCATCHGADARGAVGFPNLADSDWLWGNSAAAVTHSITHGRVGVMPPWGQALGEEGVRASGAYVRSLAGQPQDAELVEQGRQHYATMCIACHGPTGQGMQMLGAPNLTDDVWLYGSDDEALRQSIAEGRAGNMPAHSALLSAEEIKLLTAYVLQLGGNNTDSNGPGQ